MKKKKYENIFSIYLIFLLLASIIFLYIKNQSSVDWNTSEWLINYEGGFTRRGLIGQIAKILTLENYISLRQSILILQIFFVTIYYYLIFIFLKNLKKNILLVFCIFSPLFLLFPLAELESLVRKEIFLFIVYIFFLIQSLKKFNNLKSKLTFFVLLPVTVLIWEGAIIYYVYFLVLLLIYQLSQKKINFLEIIVNFTPTLIIFFLISNQRLTENEITIMCKSINECYGAINYLNNSLASNIHEVTSKFKLEFLFRYFVAFVLGYFPFILLILSSYFKENIYWISLKKLFLILFLTNFIFYFIAIDWGRWLNISYIMNFLLYVYLLRANIVVIDFKSKIFLNLKYISSKYKTLIFIIFSFSWNIKTTISESIGSLPLYRIFIKLFKYLVY